MRVNYVREMEGFGDWAEANRISGSERLVWLALFRIFNARAYGGEWPGGYVEIKNRQLEAESGLSRVTIWRAREKLARRGILDYTLGDGGTLTAYKLHYISVDGAPSPVQVEQGGVQSEQGAVQIEQGGVQVEQGLSTPIESNDINANINNIQTEEEEKYNNNNTNAPARERGVDEAIKDAFREKVGRAPTPAETQTVKEIAEWNGSDAELVYEAISRGAQANWPAKYAATCLMSWGDEELRTLNELEVYERYSDMAKTARPDIAEKGREKLKAFLREIKLKHRMGVTA